MSINLTLSTLSRAQLLERLRQGLRPGQRRIADWQGGTLAVSAVPGSGKSTGMAIAAAILLAQRDAALNQHAGGWEEEQSDPSFVIPGATAIEPAWVGNNRHLLLVTFTRSAVANLKTKIRQYLRELGVPPQGFMVHTLHGLALHIATRHPELSGLDLDRLTLISPTQSNRLIRTSVEQWWAAHPQTHRQLLEGRYFDGEETERLRRQMVLRAEVLPDLAATVIHEAKSSGLSPEAIWELARTGDFRRSAEAPDYPVLAIAAGLYERYQRLLQQRGFIDYDDMILAALHVLRDDSVRQFWQAHILAVFEDEAQDSSPLQTRLLEILATDPAQTDPTQTDPTQTDPTQTDPTQTYSLNLVRVGDPNQAINSTFTPADPIFFANFCADCNRTGNLAEMDQAGRSSPVIMAAANFLLDWVNQRYGEPDTRARTLSMETLPFRPQHIYPVSAFDPQPDANPDPEGAGLEIRFPPDIYQSVNLIARRVAELLTREPEARAAILVRENRQGQFISKLLRQPDQHSIDVNLTDLGIPILDVAEQERHSHVPTEMLTVLQFLDRPHSPDALKAMLQLLIDRQLVQAQAFEAQVQLPEQFLYPNPLDPALPEAAVLARRFCTGLLRARFELPHFQLIPFIALTLQYEQAELATADKLAHRITSQTFSHPGMAASLETLHEIVRAERFEPVEIDEADARYVRPGQLTIMTMHKAKGLDWDFVFLPFLHDHVMPGTLRVLPQAQFLGDIHLPEVARVQLRTHIHGHDLIPDLPTAWAKAAALKTAEEYRLLYVAMTRARRLLWMSAAHQAPFSWSKPEQLDSRSPCPVLPALVKQFPQSLPPRRPPA